MRKRRVVVAVAAIAAAALIARRLSSRRTVRDTARRLPLGKDGIIATAGPFAMDADTRDAVLLLHGFGDTPQTLHYVAARLHADGFAVRAPLLPGHGRTLREFAASRAHQWRTASERELAELRNRYERVSIVGLSMGAALATLLAARAPAPPALVLIAPFFEMPPRLRRLARIDGVIGRAMGFVRSATTHSILDPEERAKSRGFGAVTLPLLRQLEATIDAARAALPAVSSPTLIIQSRHDNRVTVAATERAFARLGSADKKLSWMEDGGHIITVDRGRELVIALTSQVLRDHHGPRA